MRHAGLKPDLFAVRPPRTHSKELLEGSWKMVRQKKKLKDLVSDPEDEGDKPSTEVEQIITAPRLAQCGITIEVKLQDGINK